MKCSVEVEGLKLYAYHGVMPEERITGNLYVVDLSVKYPFEDSMLSDSLDGTLNYARLCEIVSEQMSIPSALLEHVAGRIIAAIEHEFPKCQGGRIRIAKTVPPVNAVVDSCAINIEW